MKPQPVVAQDIALQDIRGLPEQKSARMPQRLDYYKKYHEIVADYKGAQDRPTIEKTLARLVDLVQKLDAQQRRAAGEGLSEQELAVFDLRQRENLSKGDRERVKLASKNLLESPQKQIASMTRWTEKEKTQAEVKVFILDRLYQELPTPPFTGQEINASADRVFQYAWSQAASGYSATA